MAANIPKIERPNRIAIPTMRGPDLLRTREYYLSVLVLANRKNDSDTIKACIEWICELTIEMQMRGATKNTVGGRVIRQ